MRFQAQKKHRFKCHAEVLEEAMRRQVAYHRQVQTMRATLARLMRDEAGEERLYGLTVRFVKPAAARYDGPGIEVCKVGVVPDQQEIGLVIEAARQAVSGQVFYGEPIRPLRQLENGRWEIGQVITWAG